MSECWLAANGLLEVEHDRLVPVTAGPPALAKCDGRMDPCHLIPRREIRAKYPYGAALNAALDAWFAAKKDQRATDEWPLIRGVCNLIEDERCWVPGCRHHHGLLDKGRKLRIDAASLPASLLEYAREYDFTGYVLTEYPTREAA